jgi:WD40 repeat protein
LFSLGSVLYAICTGRPPFRAETSYGVMRRITDDEPRPIREINPDIPQWFCQLIGKLMAKQAGDRYQSAAGVADLLEACLAHVQQPTVAKLPPALQPAASGGRFSFLSRRWSGVIAMIATLGLGLLGVFAWQATEAPDIAGTWTGEEWGQVVLKKTADGEYSGTYSDTFKESPGTIEVKWSRPERRYKGQWDEGQDRSGKISLRLVNDEIRGAWTTSEKSQINPSTPELADLTWKRSSGTSPSTPAAKATTEIQIKIAAPEKMKIAVADQHGQFDKSPRFVAPARLNLHSGKIYRLHLTSIAGREGAELYPTVETGPATPRIAEFLAHNSITIEFTEEDFDQALAGKFVTKVVYLPDPEFQELALAGVETLVSTRLEPGKDSIIEADIRGSILAVIRLGNKDIALPDGATVTLGGVETNGKFVPKQPRLFHFAESVASRIEKLKDKYPQLAKFSAAEHLKKKDGRESETYLIDYQHGVTPREPAPKSGENESGKFTYDPEIGIHLQLYFFPSEGFVADAYPPIQVGDVSVRVFVKGPAADPIRVEIVRIVKGLEPLPTKLWATKEHVDAIQALLKDAPVTTAYLAELVKETPGTKGEFRLREDVVTIPIVLAERTRLGFIPLGKVYYLPASKGFYIQWDEIGASTLHYYGPFYGRRLEKLGLSRDPAEDKEAGARETQFKEATFGPVVQREVRNREAIDFDTGNLAMIPDADLNPRKGLIWLFEQRLDSLTAWMTEQKLDALSDTTALVAFGLKVNELTNADWETMNPEQLAAALQVDWEKVDPRQFGKAIHTIDPKAPPHAMLAPRTVPRTIAFQTREGGMGILQIAGTTKTGLKVRFKLTVNPEAIKPQPPSLENGKSGTEDASAKGEELKFSETNEVVLSMDSLKFMLDLDTGATMDAPATIGRKEQGQMDIQTDQVQPYHYPKELIGLGLEGVEVKASDWDASAADVQRALAGDRAEPLKQMDLGPEKHPTYFFKTRDGAWGVLQLLELVDEPKGIRLRYKTVKPAKSARKVELGYWYGKITEVQKDELVEITLGLNEYLEVGDKLDVVRDKVHLGRIAVERVLSKTSIARIESRTGEFRSGDLVFTAPEEKGEETDSSSSQMSEQEEAVAKLVLVFFDDTSRRAIPCLALNAGRTTFVITAAPATIVPDGTPHAIDGTFLELAGKKPIPVEYDARSTTEFFVCRAKNQLDLIQLKETAVVAEGDALTAVSTSHVLPKRATVVGVGRKTQFELPEWKIQRSYDDLIEVDQTFPEGTPLFKNGKLVGLTLLGSRYIGETAEKSYVVPAARIIELCARLGEATADPMKEASKQSAAPKRLRQFPISHRVGAIACSADGELIAITNSNVTFPLTADWKPVVEILDAKTGKTVASLSLATDEERQALIATEGLPGFEVGPLVFSPDGTVLAVSTGLGQLKLFNPRSGELIRSLDDEKARLADKATPEKVKPLPRAMGRIASLAFSPDGSLLASCGESFADVAGHWDRIERGGLGRRSSTGPGRLKVWDSKTGEIKHDLAGHSHAFGVAFSPDGPWLASAGRWSTASSDGNGILLWDLEKGAIHRTILIEANGGTHAVVFSLKKKLAAIGSIIFDKENDTRSTALGVAYPLSGITEWQQTIPNAALPRAFLSDGKSIVVLSGRNSVRLIDAESGQSKHEIKAETGSLWIDVALAPKAGILVIAGAAEEPRGSVEIWEVAGAAAPAPVNDPEQQGGKPGMN